MLNQYRRKAVHISHIHIPHIWKQMKKRKNKLDDMLHYSSSDSAAPAAAVEARMRFLRSSARERSES